MYLVYTSQAELVINWDVWAIILVVKIAIICQDMAVIIIGGFINWDIWVIILVVKIAIICQDVAVIIIGFINWKINQIF